jgi:nucleoside 2-deoxyribosyltransferase
MRIYVAGKWFDKPLVKEYIAHFKALGHTITHDWTVIEDGDHETLDELAEMAEWDINGVRTSDVVVILIKDPVYPYRGTCCEMGAALACGKQVIAVNLCGVVPDFYKNVFAKHKLITWTTQFDPVEILKLVKN